VRYDPYLHFRRGAIPLLHFFTFFEGGANGVCALWAAADQSMVVDTVAHWGATPSFTNMPKARLT
jgi:hypothetical protein